jgi:hypothetical protein
MDTIINGTEWDMEAIINVGNNHKYIFLNINFVDKIILFNKHTFTFWELPLEYFSLKEYTTNNRVNGYPMICEICHSNETTIDIRLYNKNYDTSICKQCLNILENLSTNHEEISSSLFKFNNVQDGKIHYDAISLKYGPSGDILECSTYTRYIFDKKDFDFSIINNDDDGECYLCCHNDYKRNITDISARGILHICSECNKYIQSVIVDDNYLKYLCLRNIYFEETNINRHIIKYFVDILIK